ncbi:MAG: B12-binding domain-containing radical SAM protein [bacterium]|nr:B12-binding domain-containing radical SAM protein [bacterium]
MIQRNKKIVLYQPKQVDDSLGGVSSKDMLPLECLTVAAFPVQDGYEVEIVDGSLYTGTTGHERLAAACEGALMVGTTGILGYMVTDGWLAIQAAKKKHPDLPAVVGGWFASVKPDLMLATGLYDAVVLGQGELTFRDVVKAIDAGEPLDDVPGLALWRDGEMVKTEHRSVVSWDNVLNVPWHLIDIEPYKEAQLRERSIHDVLRLPTPPWIGYGKPYFGITYFSSYGCPEPCGFCCSPIVTDRRWKCMPADRMLDDLEELQQRWGFESVRFHDANWGVMQKRARDFSKGILDRNLRFGWNCFIETHSILSYKKDVLDMMADSGMYVAEIGAEAGMDDMMRRIGKPIKGDDNIEAAVEMDRRGIQGSITYIIGYPGESEESMMATIDQCRRLQSAAPLARPNVWPFRPIPGTKMWDEAEELGYQPPRTIPEWGSIGEYHLEETWPGNIPQKVADARMMYQHYATLSWGLARGHNKGWWERRAANRIADGSFVNGKLEAKAFGVYNKIRKRLTRASDMPRTWVDPGHKTGTAGNEYSNARKVMTDLTKG